jgi:hypothetical protein
LCGAALLHGECPNEEGESFNTEKLQMRAGEMRDSSSFQSPGLQALEGDVKKEVVVGIQGYNGKCVLF